MRRLPPILTLAVLVYLAHRALVLHTAFDTLCIQPYEVLMGNIAQVALMGWPGAPLHQFYDNCGGHLVTGLLAAPLFAAFGGSYLVLKLVPVTLGLLTLLMLWSLLNRHFSRRAADIGALLFVLGPPTLVKFSMLAMGNHFENLFFQVLVLWLFYRMHSARRKEPWLAVFGLAAGFAIFIYFGTFVTLGVLALVHVGIRGLRRIPRDALSVLGPLLVGLTPLLWIQTQTLGRPGRLLAKWSQGSSPLERIQELLFDLLPRAGTYAATSPRFGPWAERGYLLVFVVCWFSLALATLRAVRSAPRGPGAEEERARFRALEAAPLLGYLPLFVLFYAFSSFRFSPYGPPVEVGQFRYLVPHFCMASMVAGVGLARLLDSPRTWGRTVGWGLAGVTAAVLCVPLFMVDWSFKETGSGRLYRAYEFNQYNNTLMRDSFVDPETGLMTWDMDLLRAQMGEFDDPLRHQVASGVGYHLAGSQGMGSQLPDVPASAPYFDLQEILSAFPDPDLHPDLARGAGMYLHKNIRTTERLPDTPAAVLQTLAEGREPLAPYLLEGLCLGYNYGLARSTQRQLRRIRTLAAAVPVSLRWAWARGLGVRCGQLLARGIVSDRRQVEAQVSQLRDRDRDDFWVGVGRGLVCHGEESLSSVRLEDVVPAEFTPQACFGYGLGSRDLFDLQSARQRAEAALAGLDAASGAELERGLSETAPAPRYRPR